MSSGDFSRNPAQRPRAHRGVLAAAAALAVGVWGAAAATVGPKVLRHAPRSQYAPAVVDALEASVQPALNQYGPALLHLAQHFRGHTSIQPLGNALEQVTVIADDDNGREATARVVVELDANGRPLEDHVLLVDLRSSLRNQYGELLSDRHVDLYAPGGNGTIYSFRRLPFTVAQLNVDELSYGAQVSRNVQPSEGPYFGVVGGQGANPITVALNAAADTPGLFGTLQVLVQPDRIQ
jgi:hypothetical protein